MDYLQHANSMLSKDKYAVLTGLKVDEVSELYARCSFEIGDMHMNSGDNVMGGAIFTLADFAFGTAANSVMDGCVTLSSSINFIRPAREGTLYAEAKCVRDGWNVCFFRVTVTDGKGQVVAEAQFNGFRTEHIKNV